jgi:hypothetical protein
MSRPPGEAFGEDTQLPKVIQDVTFTNSVEVTEVPEQTVA